MKEFHSIVISGGSMKAISVIGILKYLEDVNRIDPIKNYVATSAGTIMSFLIVLNYKADEIVKFLLDNLYDDEINTFEIDELFNILSEYGLSKGTNLITFLQRALYNKLKVNDIDFITLSKITGKNFVVCIANLTQGRSEFYNVDNTPTLSVITAIRISCSLPFILTPMSVNGDICIDGGYFNNFPIDYFKDDTLKDILGINIKCATCRKADTFIKYISLLMNALVDKANSKSINDKDRNIITIDFQDESLINFTNMKLNFPKEKMKEYIKSGYDAIKNQLSFLEIVSLAN